MALTERDKRMLMILGVVAALAVVYLFLSVLRGGGGGPERAQPAPSGTGTPTIPPTPTETPRTTSPPVSLVADRDPFSIPPGLSPSPTGGGVSPTGTASPTTTASPTASPTTSPTASPTASPTSPPETDQIIIGGHDVRLLDVFAKRSRVQVEVDGRVWTVEEGAIFADVFKLEKVLDDRCARFLFGDQAFELCAQARK